MSWALLLDHLLIVVGAISLAIVIGLPLGVVCYFFPKPAKAILWVVDVLQTIPALALLGIIMVLIGAGKPTVIIGIALYSLLPIVRNTELGLRQVNEGVKEAAKGMGMSSMYRLIHVEFPLAFPVILTGIRIAAVNSVGSAVFASMVGGGGIGESITNAIRIRNMSVLLKSTATLMLIAIVLDLGMGLLENRLGGARGGRGKKTAHTRQVNGKEV